MRGARLHRPRPSTRAGTALKCSGCGGDHPLAMCRHYKGRKRIEHEDARQPSPAELVLLRRETRPLVVRGKVQEISGRGLLCYFRATGAGLQRLGLGRVLVGEDRRLLVEHRYDGPLPHHCRLDAA